MPAVCAAKSAATEEWTSGFVPERGCPASLRPWQDGARLDVPHGSSTHSFHHTDAFSPALACRVLAEERVPPGHAPNGSGPLGSPCHAGEPGAPGRAAAPRGGCDYLCERFPSLLRPVTDTEHTSEKRLLPGASRQQGGARVCGSPPGRALLKAGRLSSALLRECLFFEACDGPAAQQNVCQHGATGSCLNPPACHGHRSPACFVPA